MSSLVHRTSGRRRSIVVGAGAATAILAASLSPAVQAHADGGVATVYVVTQEGLTVGDGARLADSFGIGNALFPNGSFQYVDGEKFQRVPQKVVEEGRDEDGNPTVTEVVDAEALGRIKPYPDELALQQAERLASIALVSEGMTLRPSISHTDFTITDDKGNVALSQPLDTSVSFDAYLDGLPLTGQGANLHVTFDENGVVTELSESLRALRPDRKVDVISPDEAREDCKRLYGDTVEQGEPALSYQMPALTSANADGIGTVKEVWPQYTCNPLGQEETQASRLVPAVRDSAPSFSVDVRRSGDSISATSKVDGGTAPYTYKWSSSTTVLDASTGPDVTYRRTPREGAKEERLSLQVTDANGLSAIASIDADGDGGHSGTSQPGGGGFALAEVGIAQTVDEWQCAQDSAIGFKAVMQGKGQFVDHDWRGASSFEKDFKDASKGGWDHEYADDVDAQWYTGHGWPGGFTFKSNVDDTSIVPADARWGNDWNLEWLQLESCQVLRDAEVWRESFRGLHMMNGFVTNAYCIDGGTGGTFAQYLFPLKFGWWTLRPAYSVRQAWATMALLKEPHGVKYRSYGPAVWAGLFGGFKTNMNDHFWGQGTTGPDLISNGWWWSLTGTV